MTDAIPFPALPDGGDWPRLTPGWVWLCGAGPGDPGLVTLHTLNALHQADVVVHDALIDPGILSWARDGAQIIAAGKRGGRASPKQAEISAQLIDLSRAGKRVVRLKGGDPYVFGRGGEEAQTLIQNGVPVRVVPGISSGIGGLAYAGIPLTHRDVNSSVTLLTGHDQRGDTSTDVDWGAIARGAGVLVIYMGLRNLDDIAARLIAGGRSAQEPVAILRNAALPDQVVLETTLEHAAGDARDAGLSAPVIVCIGRAVLLRHVLDWQALERGETPRDLDPLGTGRGTPKA